MGRNIYFSENEISILISVCEEWQSIMGEGIDTVDRVDNMLTDGLGSALMKLYKGKNGEKLYGMYRTKKSY